MFVFAAAAIFLLFTTEIGKLLFDFVVIAIAKWCVAKADGLTEPITLVGLLWNAVILVWPYACAGLLLILILRAI